MLSTTLCISWLWVIQRFQQLMKIHHFVNVQTGAPLWMCVCLRPPGNVCKHTQIPPAWKCDRGGIRTLRVWKGGLAGGIIAGFPACTREAASIRFHSLEVCANVHYARWLVHVKTFQSVFPLQCAPRSSIVAPHCCIVILSSHRLLACVCVCETWVWDGGGSLENISCWKYCDLVMAWQQKSQQRHITASSCSGWESTLCEKERSTIMK